MPKLSLRTADGHLLFELPVSGRTLDVLVAQLERLKDRPELDAFAGCIGARLDDAIESSVEPGVRNPTRPQIEVAARISSELGRYQKAMDAFLAADAGKLSVSRTRTSETRHGRPARPSLSFR